MFCVFFLFFFEHPKKRLLNTNPTLCCRLRGQGLFYRPAPVITGPVICAPQLGVGVGWVYTVEKRGCFSGQLLTLNLHHADTS